MREIITRILNEAINAPSGSNSQPWHFKVVGNTIEIIAEPEKDHPVFNYRNRGTLVAHGALITNIEVIAHSLSFRTETSLLPSAENPNITARIALIKDAEPSENDLANAVAKRATNRKAYEKTPLSERERQEILSEAAKIPSVKVQLIEDSREKKIVGEGASVNEIVMFSNKTLHGLFFEEILWDKTRAQNGESGLYVKTMELAPPQEKLIKLLGRWPIMKIATSLGLARKIASDNAKGYQKCAAMAGFIINDDDKSFIEAGMSLERIWLATTSLGLSAHMLTGTLFMDQQIASGTSGPLSKKEGRLINAAYEKQAKVFQTGSKRLALILRIGKSNGPSAISNKKAPAISFAE